MCVDPALSKQHPGSLIPGQVNEGNVNRKLIYSIEGDYLGR